MAGGGGRIRAGLGVGTTRPPARGERHRDGRAAIVHEKLPQPPSLPHLSLCQSSIIIAPNLRAQKSAETRVGTLSRHRQHELSAETFTPCSPMLMACLALKKTEAKFADLILDKNCEWYLMLLRAGGRPPDRSCRAFGAGVRRMERSSSSFLYPEPCSSLWTTICRKVSPMHGGAHAHAWGHRCCRAPGPGVRAAHVARPQSVSSTGGRNRRRARALPRSSHATLDPRGHCPPRI